MQFYFSVYYLGMRLRIYRYVLGLDEHKGDNVNNPEIDLTHGWPKSGYRCNGCLNSYGRLTVANCTHYRCPVMLNIDKLTPTINATLAAEILGVSKMTVALYCKRGEIPGAYYAGCWQIPKRKINEEPMCSMGPNPGRPRK